MWPHNLHVTTPFQSTVDWGVCDRCGFLYDLSQLPFQYDQRGATVANLGLRVCSRTCYDEVATTLAPIVIVGPEGTVKNPRPTAYQEQNEGGTTPPNLNGFPFASPNDIPDGP